MAAMQSEVARRTVVVESSEEDLVARLQELDRQLSTHKTMLSESH